MTAPLVIGYDGSDGAHAALEEAARIARGIGAEVVVAFGYGVAPSGGETADHRLLLEQRGQKLADEALARLHELGATGSIAVVDERPAESLLRVALEHAAQMIVVGTHGEGPISGTLLGSVPYKLVHRSHVPVLVVPAPARV
jgi:nucleotide-binding universal stress UspA family protein